MHVQLEGETRVDVADAAIDVARGEFRAGLHLLAAFPPIGVVVLKHVLGGRLGLAEIRRLLFAGIT